MGRVEGIRCPSVQSHHWLEPQQSLYDWHLMRCSSSSQLGLTDEETVEQIRENDYMQYFLGYASYFSKAPFDPSMMVHFR